MGENGRNYSSRWNEQADFAFSDLEALKCEDWYELLLESSRIRYIPTYRSSEFGRDKDSGVRAVRLLKHLNSGRHIGLMDVSIQQEQFARLFKDGAGQENPTGYDHGYFPANMEGVYSQICFITNETTGWKIVMYETMQKSAWFGNQGYLWMVGIAVVYFLLALLMSGYNARYISRPVHKLKEDIHRAYKGNLSVRAQVETKDEFGQLSLQFNQMIGRIEELIVQLGSWLPFQDAE